MTINIEEFEFYQNRTLLKPFDNVRKLNGLYIDYTKI